MDRARSAVHSFPTLYVRNPTAKSSPDRVARDRSIGWIPIVRSRAVQNGMPNWYHSIGPIGTSRIAPKQTKHTTPAPSITQMYRLALKIRGGAHGHGHGHQRAELVSGRMNSTFMRMEFANLVVHSTQAWALPLVGSITQRCNMLQSHKDAICYNASQRMHEFRMPALLERAPLRTAQPDRKVATASDA